MDNRPIGVFDSGLGGLTVVRALRSRMPGEEIVYFGDTGRVPYGTRSRETILSYARQDENFLLSQNVKLIIAACGTVSSVAPQTGKELPVPFLGVVEPAAEAAAKATRNGRIGVIGTTATIGSGAYDRALMLQNPNLMIVSADCPLFVPMVEAGWISRDDEIMRLTVRRYLKEIKESDVDTLILGCTHYPLIADIIRDEMGEHVTLISSGDAAATAAAEILKKQNLQNEQTANGSCRFFVTDRPDSFSATAGLFLQTELDACVQKIPLEELIHPNKGAER